jgi:ferredoxin/DNA-binding MarR family transcriptional regulator
MFYKNHKKLKNNKQKELIILSNTDYYEEVRQKLTLGPLFAPKHPKTIEIMKLLWNDEEIQILSHFPIASKTISLSKLVEKTGIQKKELKNILNKLAEKGTISKSGNRFGLLPLAPGVFEKYYLAREDTEENLEKIAVIFREFFDKILPQLLLETKFKLLRPVLPYNAQEKLIQIDETINAGTKVLTYELVEALIDKHDVFAVVPCQCRLLGQYAGQPCKLAPVEDGCLFGGVVAEGLIAMGLGRKLNKAEAIEYVKKCERNGLVHNTVDDISAESQLFICNCCSCHCGVLYPTRHHRVMGVSPSNYIPQINPDLCVKCGTCAEKCPMGAIYHIYPNKADSSDEYMLIRREYCIGCGVCAVNCPNNAITLQKIKDELPQEKLKIGNKSFLELFL